MKKKILLPVLFCILSCLLTSCITVQVGGKKEPVEIQAETMKPAETAAAKPETKELPAASVPAPQESTAGARPEETGTRAGSLTEKGSVPNPAKNAGGKNSSMTEQHKSTAGETDITGRWNAPGGRWGVDITRMGSQLQFSMSGSDSARSGSEFRATLIPDTDRYNYSDGTSSTYMYGESGEGPAWIDNYTGATGFLELLSKEEYENLGGDPGWYEVRTLARSWTTVGGVDKAAGTDPVYLLWYNLVPDYDAKQEYIFWYSDQLYLTQNDIYGLPKETLRIARNEIYARHGRRFSSQDLQNYFNGCSWYHGTVAPENFDENVLSAVEKANVKLLDETENPEKKADASRSEGTIAGLMAEDIVGWYKRETGYSSSGSHSLFNDSLDVGSWVARNLGYADSELMSLSRNIGNAHEWLFGTDISNNISNNFVYYYAYYFSLKDYYTSDGKNSRAIHDQLVRECGDWGYADPEGKIKDLYNDIQPFITACNNRIRAMKK